MYNKCDKCGKQLGNYDPRRLVLGLNKEIMTRCMPCYENYGKLKSRVGLV